MSGSLFYVISSSPFYSSLPFVSAQENLSLLFCPSCYLLSRIECRILEQPRLKGISKDHHVQPKAEDVDFLCLRPR